MNFSRISSGGAAGFLASAISGPVYVLSVLAAPIGGDIFELDGGVDLLLTLPIAMLFGCVLAGLPSIFLGMLLGAVVSDRPVSPDVIAGAMLAGAVGGAVLLRSLDDLAPTTGVALRGAVVGAVTAYAWTRLYVFLRNRKPTIIIDGLDPS